MGGGALLLLNSGVLSGPKTAKRLKSASPFSFKLYRLARPASKVGFPVWNLQQVADVEEVQIGVVPAPNSTRYG